MVNKRTNFEKNVVLASISGGGGGVNDLNQKGAKQSGNTGDNILNHDFLMCMLGAHYII